MTIRIVVAIRNRILVETRTDIINHLCIQVMNIEKLEKRGEKKKRRTRVLNMYDNHLRVEQAWTEV